MRRPRPGSTGVRRTMRRLLLATEVAAAVVGSAAGVIGRRSRNRWVDGGRQVALALKHGVALEVGLGEREVVLRVAVTVGAAVVVAVAVVTVVVAMVLVMVSIAAASTVAAAAVRRGRVATHALRRVLQLL